MAHSAVPLDSADHEVLDVHHTSPAGFHGDHIEAFANQTVTRYKRNLLTLSEGAGLTGQRCPEEQEEEGGHRRTPESGGFKSDQRHQMFCILIFVVQKLKNGSEVKPV